MSDKYNGTESDKAAKKMLQAAGVKTRQVKRLEVMVSEE